MSLLARSPIRARKGIDQAAEADIAARISTLLDRYNARGTTGMLGLSPALAINVMTVYQCVTILSNAFAQLPLMLYRRDGEDRERATDHPLWRTFHDAPNPAMSSFTWRRLLMGHLATWGNAYNEIVRLGNGDVELWPIRPDRIEVQWATGGGSREYFYLSPSGERKQIRTDRMFHLQGFGSDGLIGIPPISAMRRAIGLYRKAEQYGESVFDNGARPAVVMRHPQILNDAAVTRLTAQMDELRGSGNAGKTILLEEGLDITEIGFPPEDAQFMETRLFQRREIVTGFDLPLGRMGDPEFADEKEDETSRKLIKGTMTPHFTNFQQESQLQVIQDPDLFVEFKIDGYLWGDPKARADALAVQWEHGVRNADEWRAVENMPPLPDGLGKTYYVPANWVPADDGETPPVGGNASVPTQFRAGQPPQPVPSETPAEIVDQVTRAKALPKLGDRPMRQFDCPDCGKLINRMAAPGTIGYCRGCRTEKVLGIESEVAA